MVDCQPFKLETTDRYRPDPPCASGGMADTLRLERSSFGSGSSSLPSRTKFWTVEIAAILLGCNPSGPWRPSKVRVLHRPPDYDD